MPTTTLHLQSERTQSLHDPKAMAKALRRVLAERGTELSHSESLECVARQLGWRDWNTLAARLDRPVLRLPSGWIVDGSHPEYYEMGVDETEGAALIRSRPALLELHPSDSPGGFGTLMQSIRADRFRGGRARLDAQLKCQDVMGAATMWLRVDGERRNTLGFDNMEHRKRDGALSGTQGWQDRTIVLDVPDEAQSIHFGFFLRGEGFAWARGFRLSEAGEAVPTTVDARYEHRSEPTNLDFRDAA